MQLRRVQRDFEQVLIALLALCWQVGCGAEPPVSEAGVVARIGAEKIDAGQLRAFATQVPITLLSTETDQSTQQLYLRAMIVRKLLAQEVERRGIDTSQVVRASVANRLTQRLSDSYRREQLWPGTEPDEAEVLAYYDSVGLHHQRLVAGIVVAERDVADDVAARLQAGASFERLAHEVSQHKPSAFRGGDLGYLTASQAARLGIPPRLFETMADSLFSPVLPRGTEFQIIRFTDTRSLPPEDFLPRIRDLLTQQARATRETQRLTELATQMRWQVAPEGLAAIARLGGGGAIQPWLFDAQDAALPLFTYADKQVSVGQFLHLLERRRRVLTDTAAVAPLGRELLRTDLLLAEAARRAGIAEREEILTWQATLRQESAIVQMRRQLLAAQPPLSADDIRSYYGTYPDLFREGDDVLIVETLVATEAEALAALEQVEAGESLLDVARRTTLRESGLEEGRGTLRMTAHERMTNSILYAAVQAAPLEQIVGPVSVQGGYSLFEVIHRERGALRPYPEVEARAGALARKHYQSDVFEQFVNQLLEERDDEVQIFADELVLALPDSLIDQLIERDRVRSGLMTVPIATNGI